LTQPPRSRARDAVAGFLGDAQLGDPYLGDLTFNWPASCAVPVVEEVLNEGGLFAMRYNLDLRHDGDDLVVTFADITVTSVDGVAVSDEVSAALSAQLALPGFVVDRTGVVLDFVDVEALVERLESIDPDGNFEVTPELAGQLEEVVRSSYWGSWVGVWVGWGSFEDAREFGTNEVGIGGETAVSNIEMESLGTADGQLVALRSTITLEGAEFVRAMSAALRVVGNGFETTTNEAVNGRRVVTVEIVSDPATLQPSTAFTSTETEFTLEGRTERRIEERRWKFDWKSADCA
jgi:hypothetical protein